VTTLHSIFEFFNFQQTRAPANIVFGNPTDLPTAQHLLHQFTGVLEVGMVANESLGIEYAQLRRPFDAVTVNISTNDVSAIADLARPLVVRLLNQDAFGVGPTQHTVTAVMDERDPLHRHQVRGIFGNLSAMYPGNFSYQFCDYYRCTAAAAQLGIVNYGHPMYVLSQKTAAKPKMTLFGNPAPTFGDVKEWIDEQVLGIVDTRKRTSSGIPLLHARNFHRIALNPSKDVILLVAVPGMPKYTESQKVMLQLIDIFMPVKAIECYEFNPRTQMVPGLQIPKTDHPVLSIWPAHADASGASFPATIGLPAVFRNIMSMIKSQVSPTLLRDMNNKVTTLSKQV
jgi:hypothetical protein